MKITRFDFESRSWKINSTNWFPTKTARLGSHYRVCSTELYIPTFSKVTSYSPNSIKSRRSLGRWMIWTIPRREILWLRGLLEDTEEQYLLGALPDTLSMNSQITHSQQWAYSTIVHSVNLLRRVASMACETVCPEMALAICALREGTGLYKFEQEIRQIRASFLTQKKSFRIRPR